MLSFHYRTLTSHLELMAINNAMSLGRVLNRKAELAGIVDKTEMLSFPENLPDIGLIKRSYQKWVGRAPFRKASKYFHLRTSTYRRAWCFP